MFFLRLMPGISPFVKVPSTTLCSSVHCPHSLCSVCVLSRPCVESWQGQQGLLDCIHPYPQLWNIFPLWHLLYCKRVDMENYTYKEWRWKSVRPTWCGRSHIRNFPFDWRKDNDDFRDSPSIQFKKLCGRNGSGSGGRGETLLFLPRH